LKLKSPPPQNTINRERERERERGGRGGEGVASNFVDLLRLPRLKSTLGVIGASKREQRATSEMMATISGQISTVI
jgi:hypothetical protein